MDQVNLHCTSLNGLEFDLTNISCIILFTRHLLLGSYYVWLVLQTEVLNNVCNSNKYSLYSRYTSTSFNIWPVRTVFIPNRQKIGCDHLKLDRLHFPRTADCINISCQRKCGHGSIPPLHKKRTARLLDFYFASLNKQYYRILLISIFYYVFKWPVLK